GVLCSRSDDKHRAQPKQEEQRETQQPGRHFSFSGRRHFDALLHSKQAWNLPWVAEGEVRYFKDGQKQIAKRPLLDLIAPPRISSTKGETASHQSQDCPDPWFSVESPSSSQLQQGQDSKNTGGS
ncbi:hypothetical protein RB213_007134, partial [Colletotrichum asianum]